MNTRVKTAGNFCLGVLFGLGIAVAIGFYNIKKDSGRPLVGPKIFGNIRIYREPLDPKENSVGNRYQSLVLERNGLRLIKINQSELGESDELIVYNNKSLAVVDVKFARDGEPALKYGRLSLKHEYPYQKFFDFDMDGQFDFMVHYNEKEKAAGATAYFGKSQEWVDVSESEKYNRIIKVNNKDYEFTQGDWKEISSLENLSELNKVDPNEKHP